MLYFLENHDEQRIASDFFAGDGKKGVPGVIVSALLNKNPFMFYAGQEWGERGMDAEGFSGCDGRTTIFDYWGVRSLQAWANQGKWDGAGLDEEQKELRDFYVKLLNIARTEKAITEGKMFDLEYAQTEGFNKHEQYTYLRHYAPAKGKAETLLMVMNFDDHDVDVRVRIPAEAFAYMGIEQRLEVTLKDLLTGREVNVPFCVGKSIDLPMPAWKGAIFKVQNNR